MQSQSQPSWHGAISLTCHADKQDSAGRDVTPSEASVDAQQGAGSLLILIQKYRIIPSTLEISSPSFLFIYLFLPDTEFAASFT